MPCLIVVRCRSCEALGSEKEITYAKWMRLTAHDIHTRTHSVSPRIGPRESDTFRAENHSCLYTVLWTRKP